MKRSIDVAPLAPGDRVVVACSGGADSLALLALACAQSLAVVAVYVDHGLRAGTDRDARVVRDAAAALGADARVVAVEIDARANVEARATQRSPKAARPKDPGLRPHKR